MKSTHFQPAEDTAAAGGVWAGCAVGLLAACAETVAVAGAVGIVTSSFGRPVAGGASVTVAAEALVLALEVAAAGGALAGAGVEAGVVVVTALGVPPEAVLEGVFEALPWPSKRRKSPPEAALALAGSSPFVRNEVRSSVGVTAAAVADTVVAAGVAVAEGAALLAASGASSSSDKSRHPSARSLRVRWCGAWARVCPSPKHCESKPVDSAEVAVDEVFEACWLVGRGTGAGESSAGVDAALAAVAVVLAGAVE